MRSLDADLTPELRSLYIELVKLQSWVQEEQRRILIIFEGRDAAGKGGAVFTFTRYLNPRAFRIVALTKPTEVEKGQWYFQRYLQQLPNPGEIAFFDRSWYNRAVVEPVMGFCSEQQHQQFLKQVVTLEKMLIEDGILTFKFWFSIDIEEQKKRLKARKTDPLRRWKLSTVDMLAQQKWHEFTKYKEVMFEKTHRDLSPWIIVKGNDKPLARIESMRYVLSKIEYTDKSSDKELFKVNTNIVSKYQK